ncbi:MAG TPA: hypothetical protein ENO19_04135, partial [Halothiobacillaceae bacterium]|nr:hypothetical protein [Halothiobacillaceae bacterium]
GDTSLPGIAYLTLSYIVIAVPFVFSGIVVSIALTKFPKYVSRLYAADLIGAATGCVVLVYTLELVADGPTAVLVVAALGAASAYAFTLAIPKAAIRTAALAATALFALAAVVHTGLVRADRPLIRISKVRGIDNVGNRYVRWNSFSRVHVAGDPDTPRPPEGWGLSEKTVPPDFKIPQLAMAIDVWAGTMITKFDGENLEPLSFLKEDVTNIAHYIRPNADVFVIGVGGGRDVLSALVFDQKSVTGVEINENVLRATNDVFGEFSGHLDRHPKVKFAVDEARSYITRSDERFDIIQISLIDTWAATAAGAFVLSENSLYTVEAWETFLESLKPNGVLSVSRWYYTSRPGEMYRIATLAREALRRIGVRDPRDHVIIARAPRASGMPGKFGNGIGTILVSPDPFTDEDVAILEREVSRLGFELTLTPDTSENEIFETILSDEDLTEFLDSLPIDVSAPTDDKPFFFQMLRFRDFAKPLTGSLLDPNKVNLQAIRMLGLLLMLVTVLTILCIIVPLALSSGFAQLKVSMPLLVYFLGIGFGFMFIEISQMQRLMVFLGHPTYALSVVLFTLLLGGGVGSFLTDRLPEDRGDSRKIALALVVVAVVVFGFVTQWVVQGLDGATTAVRIAAAAGILLSMGLFMGMPFPIGIGAAAGRAEALTPWLWGINGAASVTCTVLATVVALTWGISASFWTGVACYVVALLAYVWWRRTGGA